MTTSTPRIKREKGSVIVSILIVTLFITSVVFSLIVLANSNLVRARNRVFLLQAQYAAESGVDAAIAILNSGNTTYAGTASEVQILDNVRYRSTYTVSVVSGTNDREKIATAEGRVYAPKSAPTATQTRRIEVVIQRSSASTASSIMSRNILDIESGVKDIKGKDVFVNGYIRMNKNTTTLIAENISVADRNTGASNCSIGGSGNLEKPAAFTTAGQTKTKITLAYNNCIIPPGNASNPDFDVLPNQTNISKVRSTNIPFDYYMDSSYQNAAGGCADWTSGTFPRQIPSTGNEKKTHYPTSDKGISTACGNSGDLYLDSGQYTIRDHAHIRASLCAASACTPTFYNPDSTLKFIFVEGSVNFGAVQTAAGSGPMVMVVYGTDPASKASICPLGGSFYLGNSATTSAPAIYFIASNGVCLDKTRFSTANALGGISGKDLFIATNPGTPFDLGLDPAFPVSQIPVDLAWGAVRYRRL